MGSASSALARDVNTNVETQAITASAAVIPLRKIPLGCLEVRDRIQFMHHLHTTLPGKGFAKVWGIGVFDGQTVKKDHELHDGDLVELHS